MADLKEKLVQKNLNNQNIKSEIDDKQNKINKLQNDIDALLKEIERYKKRNTNNVSRESLERIRSLENEITRLRNFQSVHYTVGTNDNWFPTKVVNKPFNTQYNDGENINLDGLSVEFCQLNFREEKYLSVCKEVVYDDFKNGYRGWKFETNDLKAKYLKGNNQSKIDFTFSMEKQLKDENRNKQSTKSV